MTYSKHLLRTGSVLAVVALLSACSSSNNTTPAPDDDPEPPAGPTADQVARTSMTTLDSSVTALATLSAADDKAGSALKMAKDYSEMITTLGSDGNSRKARESAQKVLDARKSLQDAIAAAKTAKTAAETAKAALPADAEPLLVTGLDDAIKKADTQIKAAEALLAADGAETLASYVEKVTGADEDNLMTAADKGDEVATAISKALATGVTVYGLNSSDDPLTGALRDELKNAKAANKVVMHDAPGQTWAEIVGASKLMDRQISTGTDGAVLADGGTRSVKVASIAGMKVEDVFGAAELPATAAAPGAETWSDASGTRTSYKGIQGTVICGGAAAGDCKAENGILIGSWYFTPTDPMAYYTMVAGETTYSKDLYAEYGHWLTADGTVKAFAERGDTANGLTAQGGNWDAAGATGTPTAGLASSASYNGEAAGRSVHNEIDGNGKVTKQHSGRFTADVSLTATFGASPTLGGTVSNFKSPDNPDAVDPTWSVKLKGAGTSATAAVTGTTGALTAPGVAQGSGQAGAWTAQSYGEENKRPTGIYGGFNAHFTDGTVAGAYATRKDD